MTSLELLEARVDTVEKKLDRMLDAVYHLTRTLNTVIDIHTKQLLEENHEKVPHDRVPHGRG